jgi:hypothetical protein
MEQEVPSSHCFPLRRMMRTTVLILVVLCIPFLLQSKLAKSPFGNLQTSPDTVQIYCHQSESVLVFDTTGCFLSEKKFEYNGENISNSSFFPLADGSYWLIDDDFTSKGISPIESDSFKTRLHWFDKNCKRIATHTMTGKWEAYFTAKNRSYIKHEKNESIIIHELNPKTGYHKPYFHVSHQALQTELKLKQIQLKGWAVDDVGRVVLLLDKGNLNGIVLTCSSAGVFYNHWEVQPEPVTSVSYINGLHLDHKGNIYITHSSWEASSATQNSGSIIKFTPAGKMLIRIKQGIRNVDRIAVLPDDSIVLVQEFNKLVRFSSAGCLMHSWVAVPPPPGISWEERARVLKKIPRMNAQTPLKELIQACLVCEYKDEDRIKQLCTQKGPDAIAPMTEALLNSSRMNHFSWELYDAVKTLWEKYPNQAIPFLEEKYKKVSYQEKKFFALFLAKHGKTQLPEMKKILGEIAASGKTGWKERIEAEEILKQMDPLAIIKVNLNEARKNYNNGELDYSIQKMVYEDFINAFPLLEKIIFNPADTLRSAVSQLIIEARQEYGGLFLLGKKGSDVPKSIIRKISGWLTSKDPFVRNTALMALTAFGIPGHQQSVIELAQKNSNYLRLALVAFQGLGSKNIAWVEPWGATLAEAMIDFYRVKRKEGRSCAQLLFLIQSKTSQNRCLKALASNQIPSHTKEAILWGMALCSDLVLPQTWSTILKNPNWFSGSPKLISPYAALLRDYFSMHPNNHSEARKILFFVINQIEDQQNQLANLRLKTESEKWNSALKYIFEQLEEIVRPEDLPVLVRLMTKHWLSDEARYQILTLLEKIKLPDSLIPQIEDYLEDDHLALPAARLLCPHGNEKALHVLIDEGLKRSGNYSSQKFDAKLFRPFGKKAIIELIKLLDYPDRGPQFWAKYLLASLKAPEFYPQLKKVYDYTIKSNILPETLLIYCMESYGFNTLPDLIRIGSKKDVFFMSLGTYSTFPNHFGQRVRTAIFNESDSKKAAVLLKILSALDENETKPILEYISKKHPVPMIREMLKNELKNMNE